MSDETKLLPERCGFCQNMVATPCVTSAAADMCSQYRAYRSADSNGTTGPVPPPLFAPYTPQQVDEAAELLLKAVTKPGPRPTEVQIGGTHYTDMPIQPLTYIQANKLGFEEGNVVKYVSRWRNKNGIEDLKKARDVLDKKIAFEEAQAQSGLMEYLSGLFKSV